VNEFRGNMGEFDTGNNFDGLNPVEVICNTEHSWYEMIQVGRVGVVGDSHCGISRHANPSYKFGRNQRPVTKKRMRVKIY
jgi:hypothetical protein